MVQRGGDTTRSAEPPLLILENILAFLDAHGLGFGPIRTTRIGDGGGSNFSFLVERQGARLVLRRPPRPPFPPSAHDVLREARLQLALKPHGVRLAEIRAVCDDNEVIGVPFYVTDFIEGHVPTSVLPPGLETEDARRRLGLDLIDALVEIHSVELATSALQAFVRPGSYLERQVRRFTQLWEVNKTREVVAVDRVARLLARSLPEPLPPTVVHGDYRLGNLIVGSENPSTVVAVLDWEMGAVGDPRADLGYLLATYTEPGTEATPFDLSPITSAPGFLTRAELADRYAERSGLDVGPLEWFQALALWKAAVFCEAIYGRFIRGELPTADGRAARFELGVPYFAETALERISAG